MQSTLTPLMNYAKGQRWITLSNDANAFNARYCGNGLIQPAGHTKPVFRLDAAKTAELDAAFAASGPEKWESEELTGGQLVDKYPNEADREGFEFSCLVGDGVGYYRRDTKIADAVVVTVIIESADITRL